MNYFPRNLCKLFLWMKNYLERSWDRQSRFFFLFFFFYRVGTVSNSESLSGSQNTGLKDELSLIPRNKQDTRGNYVF